MEHLGMADHTDTRDEAQHERLLLLPGGKIGLPDGINYLRTLAGAALWFGGPPLLALLLVRLGHRSAMYRLQRWWAHRLRHFLGIRLELVGLGHINPHETYIVTPLHEGFADTMILWHLPLAMRFVARDELFNWRLLGIYLRQTGHIEVSPEEGTRSYRQLVRETRALIAAGESIVIFPQGGLLGIETEFMPGAFALARLLKRPLLPVALTGTHRVWEYPYTPRLRYGQRVSMRVFPPIPAQEVASADIETLRLRVQHLLKGAALSGDMAPPRRFVPTRDGYWDGYAYRIDPAFPELAADIARHRGQEAGNRELIPDPCPPTPDS